MRCWRCWGKLSDFALELTGGHARDYDNSPEHKDLKKMIGMLVEAYLQETRTRFYAGGST